MEYTIHQVNQLIKEKFFVDMKTKAIKNIKREVSKLLEVSEIIRKYTDELEHEKSELELEKLDERINRLKERETKYIIRICAKIELLNEVYDCNYGLTLEGLEEFK